MDYKTIKPYQVCTRCVMDTSDEYIQFDESGVCMRCREFENRILTEWNYGKGHEDELKQLLDSVKKSGVGKDYDCLLGLSGGLDSTYMLHLAVKEWGLRPFVFHIDCGWNLPVAENNIRKVCDGLDVELYIEKMDWEELRHMQLAWFRTGMESLDGPQDHAFISLVDRFACKLGVKYILNGYNISTEIVSNPASWGKDGGPIGDGTYMKDVIKKYCEIPIRKYTFTNGFKHKFWIPYVLGVKTLKPLNLVQVTRKQMLDTLSSLYGYEPYGQKHFESLITKFLEGFWMPKRFGHDIRRAQLSSLVVTDQITREEAMRILEHPPITEEEEMELFKEVAKRLEITEDKLWEFFNMPKCSEHFRSQEWIYNMGIKLYEFLGIEKRIRK
jgi:N-acetyl sugar amidotransferase